MKHSLFFILIIVAGCSSKHSTSLTLSDTIKISKAQAFLINLKDSMISQYTSVGSETEKQKILENCSKQLKTYLLQNPLDSMRVTIDSVITRGFTVTTKSHFSRIEFKSTMTFKDNMQPRPDSIYKFMKSLRPGSNVLMNLAFNGDFEINGPDSPILSIFIIDAVPVPL
jgi:hypothetical protein